MPWQSAPMCERCWIQREGKWEHYNTEDSGTSLEQLVSVRAPILLRGVTEIEQCAVCGSPTIIGLYVRLNVERSEG